MIKLIFPLHPWFGADLVDAVTVFLDLQETHPETFIYGLKTWAYTDRSAGKFYRKTIEISDGENPVRVVEWHCKEALENIISDLICDVEEKEPSLEDTQ